MSVVLITGGAGFIGSHLAEALLKAGNQILVLDDLSSGSEANIDHLRGDPQFEFIDDTILNRTVLFDLVDSADIVVHLAATVGVLNIIDDPVGTIRNNVSGTEAVLEAALNRQRKVILASTSEVYGKSADIPFREDGDLLLGPSSRCRWSYASSKIVDEFLALAYWQAHRLPTVVVRLFNTIGPRQVGRYGMVVPRFLSQAMRGEDVTVFGTGKQTRCFTYVGDTVQWLLRLITSDTAVGQVINLGNPNEITISDLARRVIAVTGSDSGIRYVPYAEAYGEGFEDMARRVPDITKAKAITGYSPQYDLDCSLRLTHGWYQANGMPEAVASPQAGPIRNSLQAPPRRRRCG